MLRRELHVAGAYKVLVEKPRGKRYLGRLTRRLEDNIKTKL
jgi:hypothetical protein